MNNLKVMIFFHVFKTLIVSPEHFAKWRLIHYAFPLSIYDLFEDCKNKNTYLKVCAPMVRYSKAPFRKLIRNYGVDMCFSPMILADSFCQNSKARVSEFSTTYNDTPLIVQFAANNVNDFVDATTLVHEYADGVDLNCGCPQRWAMKDGYGCALLYKPETVSDLIKGVRNNLPQDFSVSVKIRILNDIKKTINMCQQFEKCGVTFLTVHGRTPSQKTGEPINVTALSEVSKSIQVPLIVNGGVKTLQDADDLFNQVSCTGVMAASGLLTNPALFSGCNKTPLSCIKMWIDIKNNISNKITFQCYHHHLVFMLDKILSKPEKNVFNLLNTFETVDSYLFENVLISSDYEDVECNFNDDDYIVCSFPESITDKHSKKCRSCGRSMCYCVCINMYDSNNTDGSFFNSIVTNNTCELDFMDSNIFD